VAADDAKRAHTDRMIAETLRNRQTREQGYREQALKIYPWICGRCAREFVRENLQQLTVHHRDHNHDNNPKDGSNWELLCLYCHDNEHSRELEADAARAAGHGGAGKNTTAHATAQPFANLKDLLKRS
jgi:5-methylcytosine-specific restriction endonuclease McrA